MNFKGYTYKALEKVCSDIKESMNAADREDTRSEFYIWCDMHDAIQREIRRRDPGQDTLNDDIRRKIRGKRIKQYELADYLGISESAFSKLLRKPIDKESRQAIEKAIENIRV